VTPMQIEGMVDRICGLFPTTQIGRNTVKNAWVTDEFLLDADVDDARKVTDWIKINSEKFPHSLRELHSIFHKVQGKSEIKSEIKCDLCKGLLWDDGITYSSDGRRLTDQYTQTYIYNTEKGTKEFTYKVVLPCPACRGKNWTPPDNR
jgi:hypothetical protein